MATNKMVFPAKLMGVAGELTSELRKIGFNNAFLAAYADRYAKFDKLGNVDPTSRSFYAFNRGIKDGGNMLLPQSNFNVLLFIHGDTLHVWMANPDESKAASRFDFDKYVVSYTYDGEKSDKFIANVVNTSKALSALKPENIYRVFMHAHLAEMNGKTLNSGDKYMMDDGRSTDQAMLLNLLLNHADFCAVTCHNNFPFAQWLYFEGQAKKYGVQLIPGFEATLPIYEYEPWLAGTKLEKVRTPNGSHVLLLFKSAFDAHEFRKKHFSNRKDYGYPPNAAAGVEYDKILEQMNGLGASIIAHPSCDMGLPQVGLADRMMWGAISVEEFKQKLQMANGIEMFNAATENDIIDFDEIHRSVDKSGTLSNENKARFHRNIRDAKEYVESLMNKHADEIGRTRVLSPSNISKVIALEAQKEYGLHAVFGTDTHNQDWLYTDTPVSDWEVGSIGDFAAGHNNLILKSLPEKKPSAADVVAYLMNKEQSPFPDAELNCVAHYELKDGILQVTPERMSSSWIQDNVNRGEKLYYYAKQGSVLISDFLNGTLGNRGAIPK